MAHVTLHFSIGILTATVLMSRGLVCAWRTDQPLARRVGRWLLVSWGLGATACIPSLLRRAGLPDAVCDGVWMNVFLAYPVIKSVFSYGGMPLGVLALIATTGAQYAFIIACIRRARARMPRNRT